MRTIPHVLKMDSTLFEVSPDGVLLVHSSHDGIIKIWETYSNTLRSEYKPSSHLSATCSCLSWCQNCNGKESPQKKRRKSNGKGNFMQAVQELGFVAIGTVSGSILLYSVVKNDLHSQLTGGHSDRVNAVVWYPENNSLYSCSSDHHIVEWEITTTQIKQKWKADKGPVHSLCKCSSAHILSAGHTIKLWDLATKQLLQVFTGHATEVFRMLHIPTNDGDSIEGTYVLSAALNDRFINTWQINTSSKEKNALVSFAMPDEPLSLRVSSHSKEKPLILVVVTKCGKALIFEHKLNGKLKKPLIPRVTIQIATECGKTDVPRPIQILAAYICDDDRHQLLIVHGNHLKPKFEKVIYSTSGPEMCLVREDPMASILKSTVSVSKVKTPSVSKDMTLLVPGQMAPLLPTQEPIERRKQKASVGEMTLEQRLNAIGVEKHTGRGHKQQTPKADTLVMLLTQGLQSQDKQLLNHVLQNRDPELVKNTLKKLPVQMIIPLVQELTHKLDGHAQGGSSQLLWVDTLLTCQMSYLITIPDVIDKFSLLYQTMYSRVSRFEEVAQFKDRLDKLLSPISAQEEEVEQDAWQQPLLLYEDEPSDVDLDELPIGSEASDSEENLEDFSDDESDVEARRN